MGFDLMERVEYGRTIFLFGLTELTYHIKQTSVNMHRKLVAIIPLAIKMFRKKVPA